MGTDGSFRPEQGSDDLRAQAIARLKKRRELGAHALVFLLVNGFLVAVWALATPDALFWPIFPLAGWGIGLVMHVWDVYRGDDFAEDEILREMERLHRR
jgi:hypothetical protein